jgi:hypothetical protein
MRGMVEEDREGWKREGRRGTKKLLFDKNAQIQK